MSEIGERKNSGKLRWRNFPLFLFEPIVEVGAAAEKHSGNPNGKYETFNFLKGMKVNDCLDCAKRHLMKAESPYHDDLDEETRVHHLAHAAWNCLIALHNIKTRPDLDDRYKTQLKGKVAAEPKDTVQAMIDSIAKPKPFDVGDQIVMHNGAEVFSVAGYFYDSNLKQVMFIQDDNGQLYQADPSLYKRHIPEAG